MNRTPQAQTTINILSRYYSIGVLIPLVERACTIARRKQSKRLGKNHILKALVEADQPAAQEGGDK